MQWKLFGKGGGERKERKREEKMDTKFSMSRVR